MQGFKAHWLLALVLLCQASFAQADIVEDLVKTPEILNAKISPKGDFLAVLREVEEKRVVVIFKFPELQLSGTMSFPGRNEVGNFWWVNDDRIVASIVQDFDRLEENLDFGELFAMNADGSKPKHLFGYRAGARVENSGRTKQQRSEYASARILNPLWDDPNYILISMRNWDAGFDDIVEAVKLNVYSGVLRSRLRAPVANAWLVSDSEGEVRFSFSTDDDQNSVIHIRDPKTRDWSLFSRTPYGEAETRPVGVQEDGRLLVQHTPDNGPLGIYLMDAKTQSLEELYRHPYVDATLRADARNTGYGVYVMPGRAEFIALDDKHPYASLTKAVQNTFPEAIPFITSATHDDRLFILALVEDNKTPEFYLYDRGARRLSLLFDSRPWVDDGQLGEQHPITITARDGLTLHGYLTLPPGIPRSEAKNLPLIVVPHGGPHGPRDEWGYDWFMGIIPASGYAMVQINFRGSGGYGPHFEALGHGEWGRKMQDDVTDATLWAIEEGIADPDRVCLFGWSYGGYATLMGIIREPDLYRCAAGGAGVYDMEVQYREADFAIFTRWGRKYMDRVIGPTREDRLLSSPTHYVDKIQTPLLLIHGDEDQRVPVEHVNALLMAMEKAGKPAPKQLILENEAHTPRNEKNLEKMWRMLLAFFQEHIGPGVRTAEGS